LAQVDGSRDGPGSSFDMACRTPTTVKAIAMAPSVPALPQKLPAASAVAIRACDAPAPKSAGLQTSGHDLKDLLQRTGYEGVLTGAEKLDLLVWMADAVKENVAKKKKMKIALKELNDFLLREGMHPKNKDAKSTISELLALRRRELARLDYSRLNKQESEDESFSMALVAMPAQDVSDCFALVAYVDREEAIKTSRACSIM